MMMVAGRDDILVIVTADHSNANPALNGTGARYRKTNESFSRIAGIRGTHEQLFSRFLKRPGKVEELQALVVELMGYRPTLEEAEAIMDSAAGSGVTEWNHQLNNPAGILGQIIGNHTGTGWTGVSHTADPVPLTSVGPGAERFGGRVRNDEMREPMLNLLFG